MPVSVASLSCRTPRLRGHELYAPFDIYLAFGFPGLYSGPPGDLPPEEHDPPGDSPDDPAGRLVGGSQIEFSTVWSMSL